MDNKKQNEDIDYHKIIAFDPMGIVDIDFNTLNWDTSNVTDMEKAFSPRESVDEVVINEDIKQVAKVFAKQAILNVRLSSAIDKKERDLIFEELKSIANGITELSTSNPESWKPYEKHVDIY